MVDVDARMEKLGNFQLVMAHERANAQGLVAEGIVRIGHLREELVAVAEEIGPTIIVMGGSMSPDAAFEDTALQDFAADLQTETGIEVLILEQNE